MANIDPYLNAISQAVYGNEVRGSIVDAIREINTEVESDTTKANQAVSTANSASTSASNAVTTANAANTKADNAVTTANTANTKSDNAVTTSNAANTKSDNAVSTANEAKQAAITAQNSASANAQATAQDVVTITNLKNDIDTLSSHIDNQADHIDEVEQTILGQIDVINGAVNYVDGVKNEAEELAETIHNDAETVAENKDLTYDYMEIARQAGIQKLVSTEFVLYRDDWVLDDSNDEVFVYRQEVDVTDMSPTTVGFVGVSNLATEVQRLSLSDTNVILTGQGVNKLYFKADDIPAVDIPMVVIY